MTEYFPPLRNIPDQIPRRGGPIRRMLGRLILKVMGWKVVGSLPNQPKFVVTAAPHTSNWDFILGMSMVFSLSLDVSWLGKKEIFWGPLSPLFKWLGGIPVDRSSPGGIVDAAIGKLCHSQSMILAIAPEGTRKAVARWKTGFYRIAQGSEVPIVLGFFDYSKRQLGFGRVIAATQAGDTTAIDEIRDWYSQFSSNKNPNKNR